MGEERREREERRDGKVCGKMLTCIHRHVPPEVAKECLTKEPTTGFAAATACHASRHPVVPSRMVILSVLPKMSQSASMPHVVKACVSSVCPRTQPRAMCLGVGI